MAPATRVTLILLVTLALAAGCLGALRPGFDPGPGGAAYELLRASAPARILIVVHAEAGGEPDASALVDAKGVLADATGKSVDFAIQRDLVGGKGPGATYTLDDIYAVQRATPRAEARDGTSVLEAFALAGSFNSSSTLALAYRSHALALFEGKIKGVSGQDGCSVLVINRCGAPEERFVTRAVFVHEVGHLLGLVNNGLTMVRAHEDAQSPGHSMNKASVMYHAVEFIGDATKYLDSGDKIPWHFDADDQADLDAAKK